MRALRPAIGPFAKLEVMELGFHARQYGFLTLRTFATGRVALGRGNKP